MFLPTLGSRGFYRYKHLWLPRKEMSSGKCPTPPKDPCPSPHSMSWHASTQHAQKTTSSTKINPPSPPHTLSGSQASFSRYWAIGVKLYGLKTNMLNPKEEVEGYYNVPCPRLCTPTLREISPEFLHKPTQAPQVHRGN